jgi:tetratricopeptide (TPR) repeat protein
MGKDKQKMSMQTAASLFMVPPLKSGLYQQLLTSVITFQDLGNRLIKHAHHAKAFRRVEEVRQAAEILCNLPIKDYQVIGQYYLAWGERKTNPHAIEIFEKVAETAPANYRAFAMHSLAALAARNQDHEAELYWFAESLKAHPSAEAFIGMAVIKAKEGYHKQALKDLEQFYPFARYAQPHIYFAYLNSLAVELGEAGRKYEAHNIIKYLLATPYAFAYPEWHETAEELKGPNRSFVVIDPSPARMGKLLSMPVVEHAEPAKQDRPARVLNLQEWKKKMGKDKNGDEKDDQSSEELDDRQIMLRIIQLVSEHERTEDELRDMLDAVEKVVYRKKDN